LEQFQSGKITFTLSGQKLKGRFSLVRTNIGKGRSVREVGGEGGEESNQWLFIKANDEFASTKDLTADKPESILTGRTNVELEHQDAKGKTKKEKRKRNPSYSQEPDQKTKQTIKNYMPQNRQNTII
jgi:bifunctional non-homologous end joining protein LigD